MSKTLTSSPVRFSPWDRLLRRQEPRGSRCGGRETEQSLAGVQRARLTDASSVDYRVPGFKMHRAAFSTSCGWKDGG